MQSLDVISVNLWQIFASLCNLVIIFLIIKKFLYNRVKAMLKKRQSTIDKDYSDANEAKEQALSEKLTYDEKLKNAKEEANDVIKSAVDTASAREKEIIDEAKIKAEDIIRQAQSDAQLEMKKAEHGIKAEIVNVSTALTEKMLEREISPEDNKKLIDSFIEEIGGEDDGN